MFAYSNWVPSVVHAILSITMYLKCCLLHDIDLLRKLQPLSQNASHSGFFSSWYCFLWPSMSHISHILEFVFKDILQFNILGKNTSWLMWWTSCFIILRGICVWFSLSTTWRLICRLRWWKPASIFFHCLSNIFTN